MFYDETQRTLWLEFSKNLTEKPMAQSPGISNTLINKGSIKNVIPLFLAEGDDSPSVSMCDWIWRWGGDWQAN